MTTTAPRARLVDALTGTKAPAKFFEALSEADETVAELTDLAEENARLRHRVDELDGIASVLIDEKAALAEWRLKVADALGLAETVEGVGFVVTVRTAEEAAEYAHHYAEVALAHEQDCPVYCDDDERYEMVRSCKHCNGSGCGPGTASGAYEECQWCAGDGRDHSTGYFAHACDAHANLTDERDEALIRADELHQSLNDARAEVVRLQRQLEQARALESWHGIASGGIK